MRGSASNQVETRFCSPLHLSRINSAHICSAHMHSDGGLSRVRERYVKRVRARNFSIDRRARPAASRGGARGESRCPRVSIPITPSPSASPRERRSVVAGAR